MKANSGFLLFFVFFTAVPVFAKVSFTGYADFRLNPHTRTEFMGSEGLARFNLAPRITEGRDFRTNAVGIFATTNLREDIDFLMDVTYGRVGFTTGDIRLQYAYLRYMPIENLEVHAGKVTLPIGYYNQNRFYPFQRVTYTAPVFQGAILGVPIADSGVAIYKRFDARPFQTEISIFGVNGYGSNPTDPAKFRPPRIAGGLALSGNLGAVNNNKDIAAGARLQISRIGGQNLATGVSYYRGDWDPQGDKPLKIANAYLHTVLAGRLDILTELLQMDVSGDAGMAEALGNPDWQTVGGFVHVSFFLAKIWEMPLSPFAGAENYMTRGRGGGTGKERLDNYKTGFLLRVTETVELALEINWLKYQLPMDGFGRIWVDSRNALLGMILTF